MAIEQARSSEARPAAAPGANGGANRPRSGEAPEGNSFMAVLGTVESSAPRTEATPDADPRGNTSASKLDKPRRDAKTGVAGKDGKDDTISDAANDGNAATAAADGADNTVATDATAPAASMGPLPDVPPMTPAEAAAAIASASVVARTLPDASEGAADTAAGGLSTSQLAGARGRTGVADVDGNATRVGRKAVTTEGGAPEPVSAAPGPGESRAPVGRAALQAQSPQVASQGAAQSAAQSAAAATRAAAADASDAAQATQAAAAAAQRRAGPEPQVASTALLTSEFNPARRLERAGDGATPGAAPGHTADSVWSRHALLADATMPVAAAPIDTGSASMEDRMSAQVSYWLSQKTQNAELTLDTLDGKPVEVQITLKGNEAQVAFRADAGATRELLGSALPQLRELLGSEGLVLSGVTVNDFGARNQSGSGQSGGEEERRPRGGMRQVTAAGDIPAGPARPGGSGLGTGAGRSLDLYV